MASNPGGHRGQGPVGAFDGRFDSAEETVRRASIRSTLHGPDLDGFLAETWAYRDRAFPPEATRVRLVRIADEAFKDRVGTLPVAFLGDSACHTLELPADVASDLDRVVRLSPETAVKQHLHHSDLTVADWRRVPEVIERGEVLRAKRRHHLVFFREFDDGRLYRALVKLTSNNELFLATFHRARPHDLPTARRQAGHNTE